MYMILLLLSATQIKDVEEKELQDVQKNVKYILDKLMKNIQLFITVN